MNDRPLIEKSKSKLDYPVKILLYVTLLTSVVTTGFLTYNVVFSYIKSALNFSYPTSIPWISDQVQCERTNRNWRDGKCWDYQHDSSF